VIIIIRSSEYVRCCYWFEIRYCMGSVTFAQKLMKNHLRLLNKTKTRNWWTGLKMRKWQNCFPTITLLQMVWFTSGKDHTVSPRSLCHAATFGQGQGQMRRLRTQKYWSHFLTVSLLSVVWFTSSTDRNVSILGVGMLTVPCTADCLIYDFACNYMKFLKCWNLMKYCPYSCKSLNCR